MQKVDTMGARNPGARQAPPPDEIESAAEIAAMNEAAGDASARFAASQAAVGPAETDVQPGDETAMDARLAALVQVVENAQFERGTIIEQLRDALLEIFKHRPRAWSQMSQDEQRDLARHLADAAKVAVRRIAQVMAEGDQTSVHAKLESYSAKDGFKLTLKAAEDKDTALALFGMMGHEVVVTSADVSAYSGGGEARTEPDEPELPMADPEPAPPADDSDLDPEADDETAED